MTNNAIVCEPSSNIVELKVVNGRCQKRERKLNKDGSYRKEVHNKQNGVSSEVYAFKAEDDIENIFNILNKHIIEAGNSNQKHIAYRNKLLFLIGLNVGLRASDLRTLKWCFFLNEDGTFKDFYTLQPKKTAKNGKFVKLFFNQTIRDSIENYLSLYPYNDINDMIFESRKGNDAITAIALGKIVKDTALEAGITYNVCSHSLRKTFAYNIFNNANDKDKALVILQKIFNHSSTQVTLKYIGLLDEDIEDMYNSIEVGYEFM